MSPFVNGGHHHAVHGADVVLVPLNLCAETLDAVRNHSWNRPAPLTPEGEVVAWADRIAYVCHDFEDAVRAGIVSPDELPAEVSDVVGTRRSRQLHAFISAMVEPMWETGTVCMRQAEADALQAFRDFNFERIYLRPESVAQAERVIVLLRALVDWFTEHPADTGVAAGSDAATEAAVRHVVGMTDRYALRLAVDLLGWDESKLPQGV
jgi:dGTPase